MVTGSMLTRLLNWFGWDSGRPPSEAPRRPAQSRSATSHLFAKRPPAGPQKPPKAAPSATDFNPYNTGKFDRSASWERISKNQR
jgi:hypothetical protein